MSVKQFFSIIGAITFLYGIGLLILPQQIADAHGASSLDNFTTLNLRVLGAAFLGAGVMYWMAMPARLSYGRRAILAFTLILDGAIVILYLFEMSTRGGFQTMHWIDIAISLLTAIGAGYLLTQEKDLKF